MTKEVKNFLLAFAIFGCLGGLITIVHNAQPAPTPTRDDFDVTKKNREIEWCETHGGVAAMTFTTNRSNVICLKREAVLPFSSPMNDR